MFFDPRSVSVFSVSTEPESSGSPTLARDACSQDALPERQGACEPMGGASKTLIAICTYNESLNVAAMLSGLRLSFPTAVILVVDDNSPDGTAEIVRDFQSHDEQVEIIVRKDERGLGSAITRAMQYSIDNDYELFLNLDADLSHDPAELPKLFDAAMADPTRDVVIGSRYVPGGKITGWPLSRRMMSKFVNRFATGCLGLPVKDCSGSMRCYRVETLREIKIGSLKCTGYAVLEELLVKVHRHGGTMFEVPITFNDRELGDSKLTFREALRSIKFMIRLAIQLRLGHH